MSDDILRDLLPSHGEKIDPVEMARRDQRKSLPKKFFKQAAAQESEGGFVLALDSRPARTPGRNLLATPSRALTDAMAAEWNRQGEFIDPTTMPLTRIVNSALDGVAREMEVVAAEIVKYAGSDLLVYRAGDPAALVAEQSAAWDPIVAWAREEFGARFMLAEGVMFVAQPEHVSPAIAAAVEAAANGSALRLGALHVMTTLMGSALLALAVARKRLTPEQAWAAAHLDEDFQIRAWGEDAEAAARRAKRWTEMEAAATVVSLA
jgi:chaperone required for assembly of F1-ATPase